jgi:hypothetical protein
MTTTHPLHKKTLQAAPRNWSQWLHRWHATDDPLALQSLLYYGPKMDGTSSADDTDAAVLLYLRLATGWHTSLPGEVTLSRDDDVSDDGISILWNPRRALAKTAFKALCNYFFKSNSSSRMTPIRFVHSSDNILDALVEFLGSNSIETLYKQGDPLACNFMHAKTHEQKVLTDFCCALAEALLSAPACLLNSTRDRPSDNDHRFKLWDKHQRSAVKILLYLDQGLLFFKHAHALTEAALDALEAFILSRTVMFKSSTTEVLRNLHTLDEIDRLDPACRDTPGNAYALYAGALLRQIKEQRRFLKA